MQFFQKDNTIFVSRITGPKHNLLGLELATGHGVPSIQIQDLRKPERSPRLDSNAVLAQVVAELGEINLERHEPFVISGVQFCSDDTGPVTIYRDLTRALIAWHDGEG